MTEGSVSLYFAAVLCNCVGGTCHRIPFVLKFDIKLQQVKFYILALYCVCHIMSEADRNCSTNANTVQFLSRVLYFSETVDCSGMLTVLYLDHIIPEDITSNVLLLLLLKH